MITLHQLEQIAARNPNRRINSVIAELRAKEKTEQLRAPPRDYADDPFSQNTDDQPREWLFFSWFERMMRGR